MKYEAEAVQFMSSPTGNVSLTGHVLYFVAVLKDVYIWVTWRHLMICRIVYRWSPRENTHQCVNTGCTQCKFSLTENWTENSGIYWIFFPPYLLGLQSHFFLTRFLQIFLFVCFSCMFLLAGYILEGVQANKEKVITNTLIYFVIFWKAFLGVERGIFWVLPLLVQAKGPQFADQTVVMGPA